MCRLAAIVRCAQDPFDVAQGRLFRTQVRQDDSIAGIYLKSGYLLVMAES